MKPSIGLRQGCLIQVYDQVRLLPQEGDIQAVAQRSWKVESPLQLSRAAFISSPSKIH